MLLERDIQVMEQLVAITGKAGVNAVPHLCQNIGSALSLRQVCFVTAIAATGERGRRALFAAFFENPNEPLRRMIAGLLAELRYCKVDDAPYIYDTLENGSQEETTWVLFALRRSGAEARDLVPLLLRIVLSSNDDWRRKAASETIIGIGLSAIPEIVKLSSERPGDPILNELRVQIEQSVAHDIVPDLTWINDISLIRIFVCIANVLNTHGPLGFKRISAILVEMQEKTIFDDRLKFSPTNLRRIVSDLELLLSERWQRVVILIDNRNNRAGKLTADGRKLEQLANRYLRTLKIDLF